MLIRICIQAALAEAGTGVQPPSPQYHSGVFLLYSMLDSLAPNFHEQTSNLTRTQGYLEF